MRKYRWQMEESQLQISYKLEQIIYDGDAGLLQNVWDNLLTNAIKYNVEGGQIHLYLQKNPLHLKS